MKSSLMHRAHLALATLALIAAAPQGQAAQASLTFTDSGANICYAHNTTWSLSKDHAGPDTVASGSGVDWTVHVTKIGTSANTICVVGFIAVTNTGSAPATVGNILVNLQRPGTTKKIPWVSAAVDIANATNGDAATTAKILAAASQEVNGPNYNISGAAGTFTEGLGSGTLEFTDASNNTAFSLSPQVSIPAGQTITLLFTAKYNNTQLNLPVGGLLRAEVIVSFGNAGARGGSGASGANIDINGNNSIDTDEANVRSVPTRLTLTLPALQDCNGTVTISDLFGTTGTAAYDITQNDLNPAQVTSASHNYHVIATLTGDGNVTNSAQLDSNGDTTVTVVGSLKQGDGVTPVYSFQFPCCTSTYLTADSTLAVYTNAPPPPTTGFVDGDFCTYKVEEFKQGTLITPLFLSSFPSGMTIGVDSGSTFSATWLSTTTGRANLISYFGISGVGSGKLTADTTNATSVSGGNMSLETAALTLNIGFSGVSGGTPSGFGALKVCGGGQLEGFTVTAVLQAANQFISDPLAPVPSDFTSATKFMQFVQKVNNSFTNGQSCKPSHFAQTSLCK